jgi:hypothetical protein
VKFAYGLTNYGVTKTIKTLLQLIKTICSRKYSIKTVNITLDRGRQSIPLQTIIYKYKF